MSDYYLELIKELNDRVKLGSRKLGFEKKIRIEDVIAEERVIKNRGLEQDIELKKTTLIYLSILLIIETAVIFAFSFFQATKWPMEFRLEEWSFKLLVTATLSQITVMLLVAVRHLFPNKK